MLKKRKICHSLSWSKPWGETFLQVWFSEESQCVLHLNKCICSSEIRGWTFSCTMGLLELLVCLDSAIQLCLGEKIACHLGCQGICSSAIDLKWAACLLGKKQSSYSNVVGKRVWSPRGSKMFLKWRLSAQFYDSAAKFLFPFICPQIRTPAPVLAWPHTVYWVKFF